MKKDIEDNFSELYNTPDSEMNNGNIYAPPVYYGGGYEEDRALYEWAVRKAKKNKKTKTIISVIFWSLLLISLIGGIATSDGTSGTSDMLFKLFLIITLLCIVFLLVYPIIMILLTANPQKIIKKVIKNQQSTMQTGNYNAYGVYPQSPVDLFKGGNMFGEDVDPYSAAANSQDDFAPPVLPYPSTEEEERDLRLFAENKAAKTRKNKKEISIVYIALIAAAALGYFITKNDTTFFLLAVLGPILTVIYALIMVLYKTDIQKTMQEKSRDINLYNNSVCTHDEQFFIDWLKNYDEDYYRFRVDEKGIVSMEQSEESKKDERKFTIFRIAAIILSFVATFTFYAVGLLLSDKNKILSRIFLGASAMCVLAIKGSSVLFSSNKSDHKFYTEHAQEVYMRRRINGLVKRVDSQGYIEFNIIRENKDNAQKSSDIDD